MSHIDTLYELGRWDHQQRLRHAEHSRLVHDAQQRGAHVSQQRWSAQLFTRIARLLPARSGVAAVEARP
jgi:hypothetical protein